MTKELATSVMKKAKSKVRIGSLSDVHLGHRRTLTRDIDNALTLTLHESPLLKNIDILIVGGDWTDRLLNYSDPDAHYAYEATKKLIDWCSLRNIKLRVLKGTGSHDWEQSKWFELINETLANPCDLMYIEDVRIVREEDLGLDILYVPDEWKTGPDDAWADVKRCMDELGLEMVDIAVVHGTFEHHLPEYVKTHKHSCEKYSSIVRYCVLIGHIHTHSIHGVLLTNGSFDRTAQGQEEPKGLIYLELNKTTQKFKATFIENKYATIHKRIHCDGLSLKEALEKIDREIKGLKKGFILLCLDEDSELNFSLSELKQKYGHITWDKEIIGAKEKRKAMQDNIRLEITKDASLTITKDTIIDVFKDEINDVEPELRNHMLKKLKEISLNVSH